MRPPGRRSAATPTARAPDHAAREPQRGRQAGPDVEAGRRPGDARRPARRHRRGRRALVPRCSAATTPCSTSTSSWPGGSRRTTRSTTCSTPTRGSPRSCARPATSGVEAALAADLRASSSASTPRPALARQAPARVARRGRRGGRAARAPSHDHLRPRDRSGVLRLLPRLPRGGRRRGGGDEDVRIAICVLARRVLAQARPARGGARVAGSRGFPLLHELTYVGGLSLLLVRALRGAGLVAGGRATPHLSSGPGRDPSARACCCRRADALRGPVPLGCSPCAPAGRGDWARSTSTRSGGEGPRPSAVLADDGRGALGGSCGAGRLGRAARRWRGGLPWPARWGSAAGAAGIGHALFPRPAGRPSGEPAVGPVRTWPSCRAAGGGGWPGGGAARRCSSWWRCPAAALAALRRGGSDLAEEVDAEVVHQRSASEFSRVSSFV